MPHIFLNTKIEGNNPLENAGNLFLSPVRLLWQGKTISIKDDEWYAHQSFSKKDQVWWKKALAVLSLPITVPLGSGLKVLSRLSSHTRKLNREARQHIDKLDARIANIAGGAHISPRGYTSTSVDESEARPLIALSKARYPDELMETALLQAHQELIDEGVITPQELEDPTEELSQGVCLLATLNLLAKATENHDCMGDYLALNENVKVRDAVPVNFLDREESEISLYHHDALSTVTQGVEPLTAKRLLTKQKIAQLKQRIYTSINSGYGKVPSLNSVEETTLNHLMLMGNQIQTRYLNQFEVYAIQGRARSFPPGNRETDRLSDEEADEAELDRTYDRAINVYEVMGIALVNASKELIQEGLVEDCDDYNLPPAASQLAIYDLLAQSDLRLNGNGTYILQLNKQVNVQFRQPIGFALEGESEEEFYFPNDLTEYMHDALPPKVNEEALGVAMLMEDLSKDEKKALREIVMIKDRLLEGRECSDEIDQICDQYGINDERKDEMKKILNDINRLGNLVVQRYYNVFGSEIYSTLTPTEVSTEKAEKKVKVTSEASQTVKQTPLMEYLSPPLHKGIVTHRSRSKKVKPVTTAEILYATRTEEKLDLIRQQFRIVENTDHSGSCFFAALAQGLYSKNPDGYFGRDLSQSPEHIRGLRQAVADYYRRNPEEFFGDLYVATTRGEKYDLMYRIKWNLVSEDTKEAKKEAILQRAISIENLDESRDSSVWASDTDFRIFTKIYKRPIYIFDCDYKLRADEGKLEPTYKFGEEYEGEPINFVFINTNHFKLIIPR